MIIKDTGLVKALKLAYKQEGYQILNNEEQITVYTEGWYLRCDWDKFPRKVLASIVEHMGTLPTTADALRIHAGDEPQVVMPEIVGQDVAGWVQGDTDQVVTIVPVTVRGLQLYQEEGGGNCYGVRPTSLRILERDIAVHKEADVTGGNRLSWAHDGEYVIVAAERPTMPTGQNSPRRTCGRRWRALTCTVVKNKRKPPAPGADNTAQVAE